VGQHLGPDRDASPQPGLDRHNLVHSDGIRSVRALNSGADFAGVLIARSSAQAMRLLSRRRWVNNHVEAGEAVADRSGGLFENAVIRSSLLVPSNNAWPLHQSQSQGRGIAGLVSSSGRDERRAICAASSVTRSSGSSATSSSSTRSCCPGPDSSISSMRQPIRSAFPRWLPAAPPSSAPFRDCSPLLGATPMPVPADRSSDGSGNRFGLRHTDRARGCSVRTTRGVRRSSESRRPARPWTLRWPTEP